MTEYEVTEAEIIAAKEAQAKHQAEEAEAARSWTPVDLSRALAGEREARPEILARIDGKHLIYAGKLHWVMGEPESLKSWFAQLAVAQVLDDGGAVLYLDYEDTEFGVVERLLAMGVQPDVIAEQLIYVRPDAAIGDGLKRVTAAEQEFLTVLHSRPFRLAVLDGVTESIAQEGLELNDNGHIAGWLQRIPKRITRSGAAAIVIDHVTKAVDGRGRFALGGGHKLAGLDGVSYALEIIQPLSRADTEPVTGKARIVVGKDRPGWVRSICEDRKYPGTLEITAYPDGGITAGVTTSVMAPTPPMEVIAEVMRVLVQFGGDDTETHLVKFCSYPEGAVVEAIQWLLDSDWIAAGKKSNSTVYSVTTKGANEWDS